MSSELMQRIAIVAVLVLATVLTRFLPFLIFPEGRQIPHFVEYLGKTLPYATMGMLVIYCLKDISFVTAPHGIPELLAVAAVAALEWWKGNSLLSIGAGTVLYMFLIQLVF